MRGAEYGLIITSLRGAQRRGNLLINTLFQTLSYALRFSRDSCSILILWHFFGLSLLLCVNRNRVIVTF